VRPIPTASIWVKRKEVPWVPDRTIVLSFDDGPNLSAATTERLLDVLNRMAVKAAFCLTGYAADRAPSLVRNMQKAGHLLVNHTYSHRLESLFRTQDLAVEIRRCDEALSTALGIDKYRSRWFRPPGGWLTAPVRKCLTVNDLKLLPVTHFAFDTWCTRRGVGTLVEAHLRVARRDGAGVFVIHDGLVRFRPLDRICHFMPGNDRSWVPGAVESLITGLLADGFVFGLPRDD
jgi:peptidoglycan/xylan/chitin deacetylase (PgdA/CDA1 family)